MKMKTILVLDENIVGRETLSTMLKRKGYHVYRVEHEDAALKVLGRGCHIDIVLAGATDRNRDDFLACLRVRRPALPVILLTNCDDAVSRNQLLSSGFCLSRKLNFYMNTRPIEFSELDRLIRIALIPQRNGHHALIRAA